MLGDFMSFCYPIVLMILAFLCVVCIINKLIHIAIGCIVAGVFLSVFYTLVWGDGQIIVDSIADNMPQEYGTVIHEFYAEFKTKEGESPFLHIFFENSTDDIATTITTVFSEHYSD